MNPVPSSNGESMSGSIGIGSLVSGSAAIQPRLSCRRREQVPASIDLDVIECPDCDTRFENEAEAVACDGPGCGQVVCCSTPNSVLSLC